MKHITIQKGRHRAFALPAIVNTKQYAFACEFTSSCQYILQESVQQLKSNMLAGITTNLFSCPGKNSVRHEWRYNPIQRLFEVAPVYFINGELIKSPSYMCIPVNTMFIISFNYATRKIRCEIPSFKRFVEWNIPAGLTITSNRGWACQPSFNAPTGAPHIIQLLQSPTTI